MTPIEKPALPEKSYLGDDVSYGYDEFVMRDYADTCMAPLLARIEELELFATRWWQLEHMYSKFATADTLGYYIGRPERLDAAARIRAEHDAALSATKEEL